MTKLIDISKICKELLVHRMLLATASSIVVNFILISSVLLITNLTAHPLEWIQNSWKLVWSFSTWFYFFIFSSVLIINGIVCFTNYINPPSYASSRFVKFCHVFTLHNFLVGALYTILSGVLASLRLTVESGKLAYLSKSCEKLENNCLVEEYYFLLLEGLWIGLYFYINSNYVGSKNLQFPIIPYSKLSQVKKIIQRKITNILLDAFWPVLYFFIFYSVFGNYCQRLLTSTFNLSIEELPLDKISRLLNLSLIFYAWLHAILFIFVIQSMHLLFQAYLTEWIPFDIENIQCNEKLKVSLADALRMEKVPVFQQLGYLDLVTIAQKDKTRRSIIFTLSQPGGHPYNWNCIIENSLSQIKKFSEGLNSACCTQKEQVPQLINTLPALNAQIPDKPYVYHMRSLVSSTATTVSSVDDTIDSKPMLVENFVTQYYKNMKKNLVNYLLSKRLISYIFVEQFENKLRYVLSDAQSVIWAADAISSLAAVSLNEDQYGIVQKDLPEIIETLLQLKQSLDKLQKLNISIRKPVSDDKFLKQTITGLRSAVRRSLYRITSHFRNYIDDLALAPSTTDQLQPFFTYKD